MDRFRRSSSSASTLSWGQPLDRAALLVMAMLSVAIIALLVFGDRTAPRIREFSWQNRLIGSEDTAFTLTFNRPMNQKSVEDNLQLNAIVPEAGLRPIPGKISWAGQRMAYTLERPAPYGYEFRLELEHAQDRFSQPGKRESIIEPFLASFRTRDRAFLYLGIEGNEEGRLVLYNLTRQEKQILTPEDLVVLDYESSPKGDRVVFSATQRSSQQQGILDQKLYVVATGVDVEATVVSSAIGQQSANTLFTQAPPSPSTYQGVVEDPILLLDSDNYQNLKFDLSPDGETIVIYRVNRQKTNDFGLWVLQADQPPQPLETEPGGDFLITPDSQSIAHLQGEGLAILPLKASLQNDTNADGSNPEPVEPIDFLPEYGMVLNFAPDGSKAAMVQFSSNEDNQPMRSLFVVTNRGEENELFITDGSILDAQFDPLGNFLYCIITELQSIESYIEQPYLIAINLTTGNQTTLLRLPPQQNLEMSVAPDGLGILFDQVKSTTDLESSNSIIRGDDGSSITASQLWFFPLSQDEQGQIVLVEPDLLPVFGLQPQWLP